MVHKTTILLAEDHTIVREGLKLLVNSQADLEVVGEADTGRAAWQKAMQLKPRVVVMDVSLPDLAGAEATERIKQHHPDIAVLALTVHEEKGYLRRLLQAGASGYVLKRAAAEELILAIRKVASGGVYLDSSLTEKLVGGFMREQWARNSSPGLSSSSASSTREALSPREAEVFRLIALGYANKEIASRMAISVKTVETYKTRLMEKLGLHSRAEIVRYALEQGCFQDQDLHSD